MLNQTLAAALVFGLSATVSLGIPTPAPAEPRGEFSIVNGQDREATDFPEVVFITIPQDEHATEWAGCGGTILDDRWILSAAHCYTKADTRGDAIRIKAFTPYGKANDGHTYPTVHEVNRVFIHPKYDHENQDRSYVRAQYDVALLELKEPISSGVPHDPQTDQDLPRDPAAILQVPKVQLAASGEALPRSGEGLVVGRGASWWDPSIPGVGLKYRADTDQLKSADIPINQHCHSAYVICAEKPVDLGLVRHLPESDRHDNVAHRNPASCVGDSGGPLFVPGANGGRKQIGLVSNSPFTDEEIVFWSGDVCGRISTDYAAVSYLRPWIDTVMTANIPDGHPAPDVPLPAPPSGQQPGAGGQGGGSGAPAQPPAAPAPIAPKPSEPAPSKPPVAPPVLPTRPGDPELFKTLPTPSKGPMRWVLPALSDSAGSELSAGVNRLREAFAEDQVAPSSTKRSIALLANETKMADALASGVLQRDAALYLTNPDSLEPFVLSEFKAKGIKEVWLLGGPQALSPAIEQSLQAQGITTRRIAGSDRTQTAVEIAKAHQARSTQAAPHRFVARAYGDGGDETRSWAALSGNINSKCLIVQLHHCHASTLDCNGIA